MTGTEQATLAEFLLARIADEEDVARSAQDGTPARVGWQLWTSLKDTVNGAPTGPRGSVEASPARVIAECEAKRRIIEAHMVSGILVDHSTLFGGARHYFPDLTALATVYADHPDYRDEWRPAEWNPMSQSFGP